MSAARLGTSCCTEPKPSRTSSSESGSRYKPPPLSKTSNSEPTLQPLLPCLQHLDSRLLEALTSVPLRVAQRVESVLGRGGGALAPPWQNSPFHRFATETLPHLLGLLQHASLLGQQELRSESRWRAARIRLSSVLLTHFNFSLLTVWTAFSFNVIVTIKFGEQKRPGESYTGHCAITPPRV